MIRALAVALGTIALGLAGCGDDDEGTPTGPDAPAEVAEPCRDEAVPRQARRLDAARIDPEEGAARAVYTGNSSTPPCAIAINIAAGVAEIAVLAADPEVQLRDLRRWCVEIPGVEAERVVDAVTDRSPPSRELGPLASGCETVPVDEVDAGELEALARRAEDG